MSEALNLADIQRIAERATEPTLRSFVTSLSAEIARLRAVLGSRGAQPSGICSAHQTPEPTCTMCYAAALRGVGTPPRNIVENRQCVSQDVESKAVGVGTPQEKEPT